MSEFPETHESLLLAIQEKGGRDAWAQFVDVYRPVIYRMARRRGLQDADAQDLSQRVLISVSKAIADWRPDAGRARFRTWLARIARNAIIDVLRRVPPDAGQGGTSVLERLHHQAARDGAGAELDREHRRQVFRWAARQIRGEFEDATWLAFWRTTVQQQTVEAVAAEFDKSAGAVYTARSRVMRRLREKVCEYEQGAMQ